MKHFYFKSIFLSLLMMVTGMNVASAADTWVKTAPSELVTGDVVVIVDQFDRVALPNNNGTSSPPATKVTLTQDKAQIKSKVTEILQWIVKIPEQDSFQFYASVEEGNETWLYCTNSNTGVKVGTNNNKTFTINNNFLYNTNTSRYLGVYIVSGNPQDWRSYTTTTGNIKDTEISFYKKVESTTPALIEINETNFPDDVFRAWVAENCDKAPEGGEKDSYLDDEEIAAQEVIFISGKDIEDLKGIEYFTAATMLMCDGNKLQTLDVSKNTKLTQLICYGNKLTSLNVSKNTALGNLQCNDNQLTSLDVSNNTELITLLCQNNQLTSLDVSNNQKLTNLDCSNNLINETEMGKLVASMPTISGNPGIFYPFNQSVEDANVITTTQVNDAKAKNWNVQAWNGSKYVDYDGVASTNNLYTLVTSVSSLAAGNKVIIVNKDAGKAMSTTQNSNNRGATDVTIEDNKAKVPSTTDIQVFTLEGDANGWYFNTGDGYVFAAGSGSGKNYLRTETVKDDNAKASISFSGEDALVKFQGTNTNNQLQYNPNTTNNNPLFSCYASASQQPVEIYKQEDEKPKPSISFAYPVVEITYGDNYDKQEATAQGFSGDLVYTSSDKTVVKFHGNNVIDVLKAGTVTITATAPATDTTEESSATYTLKIYEPAGAVVGTALALDEHFDDCESTRPDATITDNKGWNGTNQFKAFPDREKNIWTVDGTASPAGNGCLKLGTSTNAGDATSPSFTLNGTAPLTFDIAPWTSSSDGSITGAKSVTITLTNAKFEDGEATKTVGAAANAPFTIGWNHFECNITGSGDVTINFHGSSQFFLDNVVVGGAQPAHEINLTFSSAGYLTWVATADIDFEATEGVTAYQITEATPQGITAEEVKKAPKGAALLLKGTGTVELKRTSGVASLNGNKMFPCTDASVTGITGSATSTDKYVLGNGNKGLGFYMLKNTLQAGKGYLSISGGASAKATFIGFEETTGISNVSETSEEEGVCYNLQGVRVMNPQKGIYIKNGKKIVVK